MFAFCLHLSDCCFSTGFKTLFDFVFPMLLDYSIEIKTAKQNTWSNAREVDFATLYAVKIAVPSKLIQFSNEHT